MKQVMAALLAGVGAISILFGLLFVVGSAGQGRRLAVGAVGLALGAVCAGAGVRSYRRAEAARPERIRAEILAEAKKRNGEVSSDDLEAALGWRFSHAEAVLATLMTEGRCSRQPARGAVYYTFPELQPRLMTIECEYCHSEFELSAGLKKCPNCGGAVAAKIASVSLSEGEVFHMDEEG